MPLTRLKALILSLCATVFLFEISNAQNKISADEMWVKVDESDYTASYPSRWRLDQRGVAGTKFIISDSYNYGGGFRANATLLIQNLKGSGMNLKTYFELSETKLMGSIVNVKVISSKRINTANGECQEFIFIGDQGIFHLKWRQRYWVYGDKAYVLTFSASQVTYDDYSLIADKIFNLFGIR